MTKRAKKDPDLYLSSYIPSPGIRGRRIRGYDSLPMSPNQKRVLRGIALKTFTGMANHGEPFADCLLSVLLTGVVYGVEGLAELDKQATPNNVEG